MARGHNEGSISRRKSDGLRFVAVSWPDGSRRRRYLPRRIPEGKAAERESERLIRELMAQRDAGTDRPSRLTLAAWLRSWIAELAASDRVRQPSVERYASIVELHIIPALGTWPLADLSVGAVQGWVDGMRDRSAKQRLGVLHGALDVAEGRGMVRRTVTRWVDVADRQAYRATPLTAQQAGALVAGTRADWYGPLWALLLGASLRINEALGLGWDDIEGASIAVRTQLAWRNVDGPLSEAVQSRVATWASDEDSVGRGQPKRKMGWVRVPWVKADRELERIALPPFAASALDTQRIRLAAARRPDWGYHGHVFLTRAGFPPHRGSVNREFHAALTRLGLPPVRPHDLRHTSLTILREQGIDEQTRMARAGHSTAENQRRYAHTTTAEDRAAADALQRVIGGAR